MTAATSPRPRTRRRNDRRQPELELPVETLAEAEYRNGMESDCGQWLDANFPEADPIGDLIRLLEIPEIFR